ncbi:hypothetical protein [Arthrobacter sp. Z4-13]
METLKKIVSNQYFPAAAVLTAVVLFWAVGLFGGLSLLHNNQPPLTTLTWMLFVYGAAVLTPLAGALAAVDLLRRWKRNRAAQEAGATAEVEAMEEAPAAEAAQAEPVPETERAGTAPVVRPSSAEQPEPTPSSVQRPASDAPKKSVKQAGGKQAA